MSAHTPGPWKVVVETRPHLDPSYYITALDPELMGSGRLEVPCHVGLAGGNSRTLSSGRTEANARLIAAAPEMLKALKVALCAIHASHTVCGAKECSNEVCREICGAIAKAEGKR